MGIRVRGFKPYALALALALGFGSLNVAHAQTLSSTALVNALRQGGYVLVLHHAQSPFQKPDKAAVDPGNTKLERQLDDEGKKTSMAMGEAIRRLSIPIGLVESSKTFRAMQTAKLAGWNNPEGVLELTEGTQGMAKDTDKARATWLGSAVTKAPRAGTNTVLITHTPNMMAAFGEAAKGVTNGEMLIYHPDSKGGTSLVGRIKIDEWTALAEQEK
jgi:phosphohistidine phosphatase SixA